MNNINLAACRSQVVSSGNIFQLLSNLTSLLIKNAEMNKLIDTETVIFSNISIYIIQIVTVIDVNI